MPWVNPPVVPVNTKIYTPNLKPIVDEIKGLSGWNAGNSMVFFITGTGSGKRVVESFDGESSSAPKLRIKYKVNVAASGTVAYITAREKNEAAGKQSNSNWWYANR